MIKYYYPIIELYDHLGKSITKDMKVLELGPGVLPFPHATHFCGWLDEEQKKLPNYKMVDFSKDKFPYEDKEFDFVYARHVLEDLYNPFNCMDEMSRIAKAGFIECPSPIAEMCKDVENWKNDKKDTLKWRGYQHHHYFVWNDGQLNFLHKFPTVEYIGLSDEQMIYNALKHPVHWNSYYMWKDKIEYKNHEHPRDYHSPSDMEYANLIIKGIRNTLDNNISLFKDILK